MQIIQFEAVRAKVKREWYCTECPEAEIDENLKCTECGSYEDVIRVDTQ